MTCAQWSVEELLDLLGGSVDFKREEARRYAISLAELIEDRNRLAARVAELREQLQGARRAACIWVVGSGWGDGSGCGGSSQDTKSAAQRLQDKKDACLVLGWPVEEVWPEDKDEFGEFIESQGRDPVKENKE